MFQKKKHLCYSPSLSAPSLAATQQFCGKYPVSFVFDHYRGSL